MWLLLSLLAIVILYIILNESNNNFEHYENNKCPKIIDKKKAFCVWSKQNKKCQCKYQKDYVDITFPIFPNCCERNCSEKNEKNCEDIKKKPLPFYYWCPDADKCKRYKGFVNKNNVSVNNCGISSLTNELLLPFYNKSDCMKSITKCDKYNKGSIDSKKKCLKNRFCGWCTNNSGKGKCVEGTPIGPLDYNRYTCKPNKKDGKNSWTIGNPSSYII